MRLAFVKREIFRWVAALGGAAAILALSACSMFGPKLTSPTLSVVNIGMLSADVFSQQFRVRLHVQNPNDRALPVEAIEYELFLQGDSFAEGVSVAPFIVPALGEIEFDMTVSTNFVSSVGRLLSKIDQNRQVEYDLLGKVRVDLPFVKKIPFKQRGSVDLKKYAN